MSARQNRLSLIITLLIVGLLPARFLGAETLDSVVQRTAADPRRSGARIGVHVVAAGSGRVIYSQRAGESFITASNQKLITAAAALEVLGEDYAFHTALYAAGPISDGTLQGDLIFRGGGDPTIGGRQADEEPEAVFARWAARLKDRGIGRISGDLVGDDLFFDREHFHPSWPAEQAWRWYYPPVSALAINDNSVVVRVKPGQEVGQRAQASLEPPTAAVELNVTCVTAAERHTVWFARHAGSRTIRVGGSARLGSSGYSHPVTVPEPALYAARTLAEALRSEGILLEGTVRLARAEEKDRWRGAQRLVERRADLVPVLRAAVQHSDNHYAEQAIKTIGAESAGVGSWETGLAQATAMLSKTGLQAREFNLDDGSGLSRQNRLSPAAITSLLLRERSLPRGEVFESLLARPGRPGTLRGRLTAEPYRSSVRAKTGYLHGVGALSGFATTRAGLQVAFSILVNDEVNPPGSYSMRETVDEICRAIVDYAR